MRRVLDRRQVTQGLTAGIAAAVLPLPLGAEAGAGLFAAARKQEDGTFSVALFDVDSGDLRSVVLPARGHDVAVRPGGRECVAFARRPGRFAVAFGPAREPLFFESAPNRHFFGHGAFSADGRLLYATENDYGKGEGVIGIRDASGGYRQIGEFAAHGVEPHDLLLLGDGRTLVVANGGIRTAPDTGGRELNIDTMRPSLVYLDVATGDLLEEQGLGDGLHQLSIRHLAVADRDTVVFGCQYRGADSDHPPLVGFHRRGEAPALAAAPGGTHAAMKNYVGSVATDSGGGVVAASAPRGGLIAYFDVAIRRFLGASTLADGCGLAPTRHRGAFLLTSGEGWVALSAPETADPDLRRTAFHWDNHAVLVG